MPIHNRKPQKRRRTQPPLASRSTTAPTIPGGQYNPAQPNLAAPATTPSKEPATIWDKLLTESYTLEGIASKIQGGKTLLITGQRLNEFINNYLSWYGEGLSVLPDDLKNRFRSEYEGGAINFKIKKFLEAPGESSAFQAPGFPYWQYPYLKAFYQPLFSQRQILIEASKRKDQPHPASAPIEIVERLARGFHLAARQLQQRYDNRPGFPMNDEYDVQDLFHAMLRPFFEDIRPEEWTPSYAGRHTRMDFLLKAEQIVIEIKKTRSGLGTKEVGEQLIIDAAHYRTHPDANTLIALIYDPELLIENPRGLEADLSKQSDVNIQVRVIITPS